MFFSIQEFANSIAGVPTFRRYIQKDINPLSGTEKRRWICEPNEAMRRVHAKIITYLRSLHVDLSSSSACSHGNSSVKNVLRHSGHRHFYITDLHGAYPSVDGRRLAKSLIALDPSLEGHEDKVYQFLLRFCLAPEGGLGVGLPASPDLFNCYAAVILDPPLRALSARYHLTYSRYLDDITFSSDEPIGARKRKVLREVIYRAGFGVCHRKSRVYDLAKGDIFINGVGVTKKWWLFLPRSYMRSINGHIHVAYWRGTVKQEVIEGMMGVFKLLTYPFVPNKTELKFWRHYKRFHKMAIGAKT